MAFSAYLDHTLKNIQRNQIIVFNRIMLNEGEGYDTTSGVFTCPHTGVYLVTFFVGKLCSFSFFFIFTYTRAAFNKAGHSRMFSTNYLHLNDCKQPVS